MRLIFLLAFSFFEIFISAQNLVLNPGFEDHGEIAGNDPGADNLRGNRVNNWYSPNSGSPDYYNRTSLYVFNQYGKPESHSGDGMAGIAVYDGRRNYREYIIGQLSQPLDEGMVYEFSIAFALSSSSGFSIEQMGIYLSSEMIFDKGSLQPLKLIPQIIIDSTGQKNIYANWVVFHQTFVATGGEKYITIGNFLSDKKTTGVKTSSELKNDFPYAYYYIDDVSIIPAGDEIADDFISVDSTAEVIDKIIETQKETLDIAAGKTLVADNVYFEVDRAILKEESFPILDQIIAALQDQPNLNVEIDGHTDTDGSDEHNQNLSEERAKAVKEYFISKGIAASRMKTKGYGRSKPVYEDGEIDKRKSRRVEFIFSE